MEFVQLCILSQYLVGASLGKLVTIWYAWANKMRCQKRSESAPHQILMYGFFNRIGPKISGQEGSSVQTYVYDIDGLDSAGKRYAGNNIMDV